MAETIGASVETKTETKNESAHITLRCQFCETWNRIEAARASDRPKCGKCGKPMLLDRPIKLDDESFSRTIAETDVPVLVDFYADWCGPCKMMAPAYEAAAQALEPHLRLIKLNSEKEQAIAARLGIRGIPTMILFHHKREIARISGAMSTSQIVSWVRSNLPAGTS